uniref:Pherophorin domain-containing protein n=1 Tax=Chromera velia CCMP2878 TaxID=1169474 RepID=A0A0G4I1Y2_9ALVE|eukprot:Cvel_34902.t1-p1 / transcript=Cvel_34902.t1 / gene=Cvel_34902 / organism=Chromera_velia_CCMP2878 / gene_product=hypothetical protein / transcript_product=hypothetical protein / location=Cvel_scaffold6160:514-3279(+) / protein_length=223 / sequence_SO=supercontig / SO=protein_coding / is_pseudo=false
MAVWLPFSLLVLLQSVWVKGVPWRSAFLSSIPHRSVHYRPQKTASTKGAAVGEGTVLFSQMAKTTPYVPGRIKKAVTFEEKQKRGKRKAQKKQEGIILKKTDELRVGKFRVEWVVNGLEKKLQYQWREMGSPPLRTSLFPLAGKRRFQLKFWPDGCGASRDGYCALMLHYPENFGALTNDINLFVGDTKKGPFKYRSPEYWKAAMSMCRLENEELKGDRIVVS